MFKNNAVTRLQKKPVLGLREHMKIEDAIDHYEERAALREYDGGQTRSEAEREALIEAARAAGVSVIDLRDAIQQKEKSK